MGYLSPWDAITLDADERAAAGWEIARKDVRNLGRDGRVPYQKRPHSDMNG